MSRRTIVAGNWKMNTDAAGAKRLLDSLVRWAASEPGHVQLVVAPPFPFLADAVERVSRSGAKGVVVAAQNCHQERQGAYTGEVAIPMLKSLGVGACIVGHSERRQYYGETDAVVARKVAGLLAEGLTPIYCCGELKADRESGRHQEVVAAQLREALGDLSPDELSRTVVAYEPVWAIGTGLTATPGQAQEMHAFIRGELRAMAGGMADEIPILYGGSCKPDNAEGLFSAKDIDGGLIGGASLSADDFTALAVIAKQAKSGS